MYHTAHGLGCVWSDVCVARVWLARAFGLSTLLRQTITSGVTVCGVGAPHGVSAVVVVQAWRVTPVRLGERAPKGHALRFKR